MKQTNLLDDLLPNSGLPGELVDYRPGAFSHNSLLLIKNKIELFSGDKFDSALLNYYGDGKRRVMAAFLGKPKEVKK